MVRVVNALDIINISISYMSMYFDSCFISVLKYLAQIEHNEYE